MTTEENEPLGRNYPNKFVRIKKKNPHKIPRVIKLPWPDSKSKRSRKRIHA